MELLPFFINCFLQDKNKAGRYITTGFMAGVVGVCMIAFWERGVISDVLYATTFTRITYLAFGVSLVFFLFTIFAVSHREHRNRNRSWVLHVMLIFMLAVFMAALVYAYQKGGQRWFSYNEFEHLPWHTKNMLLHFFFAQGLLGVIGFLALTAAAAWRNLQGIMKGEIFPIILLSAILGFQVVGLTDCPIDAPRVAFLYYMILMMSFTQALEART